MEKPLKTPMPNTDSIRQLTEFWDTHDFTDYEDQFEEVTKPLFSKKSIIHVEVSTQEAEAVDELAKSKGVKAADLVREWVQEKVSVS